MRVMVMHKTTPGWEAGERPSRELVESVGKMMGELISSKRLLDGAGLRASSLGVRLRFAKGTATLTPGPLTGENELPAAFTILKTTTMDDAVAWATQQARVLGDVEMDIRPVTEPWDIGMGKKPEGLTTTRYMVLRKATAETESGASPTETQRAGLAKLQAQTPAGVFQKTETMKPSKLGRRYKKAGEEWRVMDGPFAESKEMIAGYVIVEAESVASVDDFVQRYVRVVGTGEVDVREMEIPTTA